MQEPIDSIIIRAQQNFNIDGGLNPIEIEIKDHKISNIFKKYKNASYKIILLVLLFPVSIRNDTNQIFVLGKNLNGVKKSILNQKIFDILAVINLEKKKSGKDIKGQSVWVNTAFKDHKEINNNSHLCFPFIVKSFSDLSSFSIHL